MRHNRSCNSRQKGFSFGDFLVLIAIVGVGYMAKGQFSGPKLMDGSASQLVEQMGQPVAKSTIPRPN
ncbi:MAG: hypothetical protein P1U87_01080 [Verrucomicrobiales bacterium]|nr:hypothetical protein [Verrucomicrobiales bacterium]